ATNDTEVFSDSPTKPFKNRHIFTFNVCKRVLSACAGTAPWATQAQHYEEKFKIKTEIKPVLRGQ
ncbi:MAG: hypothetical protein ACKOX6_12970, partial [Bdellovibrio sp.]